MWKQLLDQAFGHLHKAVNLRERIYQGQREARAEAKRKGTTPIIEQQRFMTSAVAQEMISDQNWYMRQADAHSGVATAALLEQLLNEQKATNQLLSNLVYSVDRVHESLKEMKVY